MRIIHQPKTHLIVHYNIVDRAVEEYSDNQTAKVDQNLIVTRNFTE